MFNKGKEKISKVDKLKRKYYTKTEIQKIKTEHNDRINSYKLKKGKKHHWFNFFTKWFFLGIILVLLSVCISSYVDSLSNNSFMYDFRKVLSIVSTLLSTFGIALFVGCIFDFSKNSEAFVAFVSKILSDIVVSKDFLAKLSSKDKEQSLSLILKPTEYQVEKYSNINDFFKKKIREAMRMFETNFKTNMSIDVEAYKDKTDNIVKCKSTLTYNVYKVNDQFAHIKVYFEKSNSKAEKLTILTSTGKISPIETKSTEKSGGIEYEVYTYSIPEQYNKCDHLMIKRTIIEPGHDHWINYFWQSMTPYEGIDFKLRCKDNLTIKDHMVFDDKAYYMISENDKKTELEITSPQWLDENTGFSIIVSE